MCVGIYVSDVISASEGLECLCASSIEGEVPVHERGLQEGSLGLRL